MRFHIETLGCAKNRVDSDFMGRQLTAAGYRPAPSREDADLVVVNTCGFIDISRAESLAALEEATAAKRDGQVLVAAGCLVQIQGEQLRRWLPAVDAFVGTRGIDQLVEVVARTRGAGVRAETHAVTPAEPRTMRYAVGAAPRLPIEGIGEPAPAGASYATVAANPSAFLKIADGCNAPCSFCIIPQIKGGYGSKAPDVVVAEARALAARGVKEVVLIAQDTTAYGYDWGEKEAFAGLLERLVTEVPEVAWWRVMYAYPGHLTERAVEVMASHPAICRYIDMPLQHAHPDTLRRMRRPSLEVARRNIEWLRAAMPDVALRTTFIVGFPGETEEEFRFLLDFIREVEFDRAGVFKYSRELATPSGHLPDQVPEEVKEERYHRAMRLLQKVSLKRNRRQVGRRLQVLLEGEADLRGGRGRRLLVGRSYRDAPEVDGLVFCEGRARVGDFVTVKIREALPYDLSGRLTHDG